MVVRMPAAGATDLHRVPTEQVFEHGVRKPVPGPRTAGRPDPENSGCVNRPGAAERLAHREHDESGGVREIRVKQTALHRPATRHRLGWVAAIQTPIQRRIDSCQLQ